MPVAQVIVIDDDRLFGQMARAVLHKHDFSTIVATSGAEGIAAARDNPRALLLVDYHLGDLRAPEVLDALDASQPFIIITGDGESRLAVEMMKRGARDFIVKDHSFLEVLPHVVGRVLTSLNREAALQRREARLASIFEACADALLIVTEDTRGQIDRIIDANESAVRCAGRDRETLQRMTLRSLLPALSGDALQKACRRALRGEPISMETRLWGVDGELPIELTLQRLAGDDEPHLLCMARDISDRETAAAERRLLATAIEQSAESVMITNPSGRIEYVNPAFERITGFSRSDVHGETPRVLKSGAHDETFYRDMWSTIAEGETWHGRMVNRRKDGTHYEQQAVVSPVRDARGELTHFVAVARDVTREVQLQQQLLQSQKMDAVGKLAGGIAHDFNNLLLVMQSASESLLDVLPAASETRGDARDIFEAARSAKRLTRKLLAFSRRQPLQSKHSDVRKLLGELKRILRRLVRADIALHLYAPQSGNPRDFCAMVDAAQLEHVVVNLVLNARDAIEDTGSIDIALGRCELDDATIDTLLEPAAAEPGSYLCLRVSDDGSGMSDTTRARACEPFFTTKGPSHGTGLGLSTVYGIVRQHGGHLAIDSELGRGTTVSVYLPVAPRKGDREQAADKLAAALELSARSESDRLETIRAPHLFEDEQTKMLLLVEDEPLVRKATARMLSGLGYDVITAENGRNALELMRAGARPTVVVSDVVMPQMGGPELARELQQLDAPPKVLLVSGYTGDDTLSADKLPDGVALLSKPFRRGEIARELERLLSS